MQIVTANAAFETTSYKVLVGRLSTVDGIPLSTGNPRIQTPEATGPNGSGPSGVRRTGQSPGQEDKPKQSNLARGWRFLTSVTPAKRTEYDDGLPDGQKVGSDKQSFVYGGSHRVLSLSSTCQMAILRPYFPLAAVKHSTKIVL